MNSNLSLVFIITDISYVNVDYCSSADFWFT